MSIEYIIDKIGKSRQFSKAVQDLERITDHVSMTGISGSRSALWAAAIEAAGHPVLIITSNMTSADQIYQDLKELKEGVCLFRPLQPVLYNPLAHSIEAEQSRIMVLDAIAGQRARIVVASAEALLFPIMPIERYQRSRCSLKIGQRVDIAGLGQRLISSGYVREDMVEGPGQFSVRGGIVDIFSMGGNPYRIELFDDEIDTIRLVDISTQRSVEKLAKAEILPAVSLLPGRRDIVVMLQNIEADLVRTRERLKSAGIKKLADQLEAEVTMVKQELGQGSISRQMANYWMYGCKAGSLIEYLCNDYYIVIDNPARVEQEAQNYYNTFCGHYSERLEKGSALIGQRDMIFDYQRILLGLRQRKTIAFAEFADAPTGSPKVSEQGHYCYKLGAVGPFHGKMDNAIDRVKKLKQSGYLVFITASSKARSNSIEEELKRQDIYPVVNLTFPGRDFMSGEVIICSGMIREGFILHDEKLAVISDRDIFGALKQRVSRPRKSKKEGIQAFTELSPGDYVVHENHGIGIYRGILELKIEDIKRDYMKIEYGGGDTLYLPTYQSHIIQKYIGAEGKKVRLSRMGGKEWSRTKAGVKKAIENMAKELLALYAEREAINGYAFDSDTVWQGQFEELFQYQETPDQIRCIEEIKRDMEKPAPMDRLLCGDVGYGKTEVAMRAAFKAVMDGKQVAMLVPTTILAQQHYNTFKKRMQMFPVNIEMLSRFRTPEQQQSILRLLKEGNIDIIIGTHRLLQRDVVYKDLGLLIVDEEQRFGVSHKEAIKALKKNVDVLTLTATPIPRTLHMSMVGIRDMSIIQDPPEERIPVETYIVEYSEQLVRDAINRELARGGQVYFVHNRVKTIEKMSAELGRIVPNASIGVAHGQMEERDLENMMADFLERRYDVLLCTTIIENGLDMPNVNTLIVTDSDRLGLSQMYQLRGRVGRSNRLAYAYFTYRRDKVLTEAAEKRLRAIKEFTEFGAGFKIALRDLEIRGAGNILGHEQHGHMMTVGYDLYCKLLEQTVKELKGLPVKMEVETQLDIKVDAYIPATLIPDEKQKVEIYKRIASITNKEELYDVEEEIEDRFGGLTPPVDNLLAMAYIKALCKKLDIASIEQKADIIKVQFSSKDSIPVQTFARLISEFSKKINFEATETPAFSFRVNGGDQQRMLKAITGVLEKILYFQKDLFTI